MRHVALFAAEALLVLTACTDAPPDVALTSETPTVPSSEPTATPTAAPSESETATPAPPSDPPAPVPTEADPPAATGPKVELWFVRVSGNNWPAGLEPEIHTLEKGTTAVARGALQAVLREKPSDPELQNLWLWPKGTRVLGVTIEGGTLTVDLDVPGDYGGLPHGSTYEGHAMQQVVQTAGQFPGVKRVRVLEEGQTFPSGHFDFSRPFTLERDVMPPVVITEPTYGETVDAGRVTVTGNANVYEANVLLRLINPAGDTVAKTFTTATCGTGCRGTWEHTFDPVTTPGTWTVVAGASDPSDGAEGSAPYKVRRQFTVR